MGQHKQSYRRIDQDIGAGKAPIDTLSVTTRKEQILTKSLQLEVLNFLYN